MAGASDGVAGQGGMDKPLHGIKLLDFSTLLPGPMASAMLMAHGADITKIERPGGEDMRRFSPRLNGTSAPWLALNQGKAIIEMDLKSTDAFARLEPLISSADILIEQFRPGVMERLGLGFDTVHQLNPRLVYASITGYGQSGPRASEAGHDINYQARSGLLGQSLHSDLANPLPPALVADIAGGAMTAVTQVLLALRQRDRTGKGCHLDISMSGVLKAFLWYQQAIYDATGQQGVGGEGLLTGGSPRYGLCKTADGRFLAVGAIEEKFWRVFCAAIHLPAGLAEAGAPPRQVQAAIAALIAAKPAAHWRNVLEPLDCCCTIVATLDEAAADPHFARGESDEKARAPQGIRPVSFWTGKAGSRI